MERGLDRVRQRPWWPPVVTLVVASAALGATLLLPRTFSDPVGLDPYVLRLSAVAVALAVVAMWWRALAPARAVLLSLAAMTAAFSLFAGGPQWIIDISGTRFDGNSQVLIASAAEAAFTAVVAVVVVRIAGAGRPLLRLRRGGAGAVAATAAGITIFLAAVMLLPAAPLGRVGLAPVGLARDLPLAGPADALQALAQELQFRGLLLGTLERAMPPWAANLVQALFFGLAHIAVQYQGPADAFVPVTIALGLAFGWITQRTGSLWPAIVIHAVADIAVSVGVIPGLYGY